MTIELELSTALLQVKPKKTLNHNPLNPGAADSHLGMFTRFVSIQIIRSTFTDWLLRATSCFYQQLVKKDHDYLYKLQVKSDPRRRIHVRVRPFGLSAKGRNSPKMSLRCRWVFSTVSFCSLKSDPTFFFKKTCLQKQVVTCCCSHLASWN